MCFDVRPLFFGYCLLVLCCITVMFFVMIFVRHISAILTRIRPMVCGNRHILALAYRENPRQTICILRQLKAVIDGAAIDQPTLDDVFGLILAIQTDFGQVALETVIQQLEAQDMKRRMMAQKRERRRLQVKIWENGQLEEVYL